MNMSLLQVHAALYAVGCFCEVSEHFSSLAVNHLYDLVIAKDTPSKTKIQAISVFTRMHSSVLVALKAHETGKALMLSMPVEELVATLQALSKLALNSGILVAAQAELLLSYVCSDPRTVVRAMSLQCFTKLAEKATGRIGLEDKAVEALILILESADQPPIIKDLALQVLRKLFPFGAVTSDAGHLIRLLSVVELSASRPTSSQVQPAVLGFLVELVCSLGKLRPDVLKVADSQMGLETEVSPVISGNKEPSYALDLSTRVTLLVCDQVTLLGCEWNSEGFNIGGTRDISQGQKMLCATELKRRCFFLCGLLLQLAQFSCQCGFVVVDRLSGTVEALLKQLQQMEKGKDQQEPANSVMTKRRYHGDANLSAARSCFLRMMCLVIRKCGLIWLSEGGGSSKTLRRLTKLVTLIMSAGVSHHVLKDLLLLLLNIRRFLSSQEAQAIAVKVNHAVVSFVEEKDYWSSYKVVILAACHGLWSNSSAAIERIVQKAQSECTYFWLKAVAAICRFEAILQSECERWNRMNSPVIPACCASLVDSDKNIIAHSRLPGNVGEAIARGLSNVYSAENSLAAAVKLERTFEFQRRLLSLRVKFIRTSGELLGLLGPICVDFKASDVEAVSSLMAPTDNNSMKLLISRIQAVANKSGLFCTEFKKLAVAYDMLRVSYMGIDRESANMLSFASLGCSLFSFCTLCSLSIPQVLGNGSNLTPPMQSLGAFVANDLYQRLDTVGGDEWVELHSFILQLGGANEFSPLAGGDICALSLEKEACKFMSWAVKEVLHLQECTNLKIPELSWVVLARGMHICKNVVENWFCLPWALPKHFRCTRPPVSMDVFVELMSDAQTGKERQIAQGVLAPLSICFQIRNLDINNCSRVKRLCCAVLLKSAKGESGELYTGLSSGQCNEKAMCNESELLLLERLIKEASFYEEMMWEESNQHFKNGKAGRDSHPIVSCDVNEKGQGFASCLVDTSGMKCGLFHLSVLAVCLDKDHHFWIVPPLGDGPTIRIIPSTFW